MLMLRFAAIGLFLIYLVSFTEFKEVLRMTIAGCSIMGNTKTRQPKCLFLSFWLCTMKPMLPMMIGTIRLPFKDCSHSFIGQVVVLPIQKISLAEQIEVNATTYQFFYLQHEPKLIAADIFQPPKI